MITSEQKKMTPEKAVLLLSKQNIKVTPEEALAIINFMYLLADIYLYDGQDI
jgi:hypothetical protein